MSLLFSKKKKQPKLLVIPPPPPPAAEVSECQVVNGKLVCKKTYRRDVIA